MSRSSEQRVAVIGAGFTGLTAAYKLASAGVDVAVFEASADVGGLAGGFELDGHALEKAYHFLYKTDEFMLRLVDELDLQETLDFHPSSISTYYDGVLYPMMSPLDLLRFKPLAFHNRIRAGVSVLYMGGIKNWEKLATVTALDYLRRVAGRQVTDVIWEPLLKGKFDRYYDQVTMGWLWGRLKQRVETREKGESGERLGYFEGGFKTVIDALVQAIERNDCSIRLATPIEDISQDPAGGVSLVADGQRERFDKVLVTTSSSVLSRIMPEAERRDPAYFEQLRSIDYLDAAVLCFSSDQKLTDFYWHNINTPDSPFVVFLSLTALVGPEKFDGKHIYYVGDYIPSEHPYMTGSAEELKDHWYSELKKIFPSFERSAVSDDQLFRFADAQHIVDVGFESKIPDHQTPLENVLLCNFSQIYPMDRGTNYAVRDGYNMADRILSELG